MSRLRRRFLYDRYIFVTVDLLRSRSAGLALKPCGPSSDAGLFRAAQQESRCGLTIDRVRLPADEKARI